jgi:hypothetical protein
MWMDTANLEENECCRATYAVFQLHGNDVDPNALTRVLGISPSYGCTKAAVSPFEGFPASDPTGVWAVSSEGKLFSTNLERHLLFLMDVLEPVRAKILQTVEAHRATARFFCPWWTVSGQGGPVLSPQILARISDLQASLRIDYHGLPDEYVTSKGEIHSHPR